MRFSFYIKKNGADKIFISITHQGSRERFPSGFTVEKSSAWDKGKKRLNKNHPRYKTINSGLDRIENKLKIIRDSIISEGGSLSSKLVRKRFEGVPDKGFWDRWAQYKKEKVNQMSRSTSSAYLLVEDHLRKFEKQDGDIRFIDINLSFYTRLINYLSPTVMDSSISIYVSKLKAFLNYCYKSGWVESDRGWKAWSVSTKRPEREGIFYTLDQLRLLENMDLVPDRYSKSIFSIDMLNQIRKIFLFQCYTGLRHSDLKQLQEQNPTFTNQLFIDNVKSKRRRKVYLVDKSRSLFDQIKTFNGFLIDNDTYNRGIKVLSKQFGWTGIVFHRGKNIDKWKAFSSHAARYTFISIISGHASGFIVKGLADHSQLKTTEGYFQQNEKEMEEAMKKAFG